MALRKKTSFPEAYVLSIAREINKGMCAFIPMDGGDAIVVPDYHNPSEQLTPAWKAAIRSLKPAQDDYFEVLPPEGKDAYWHMQLFLQKNAAAEVQRALSDALSSRSPFSAFQDALQELGLKPAWDEFRFPYTLEHTRGAFNLQQEVSLDRIYSYHPDFHFHDWQD